MKKKFGPAFHGLFLALKDRSVRIQILSAAAALLAAFIFRFTFYEWLSVVFAIGLVVTAEIFNTCLEKICDFIRPEQDIRISVIKDMSAGAVLCASITALVIGICLILRHLCGGMHL